MPLPFRPVARPLTLPRLARGPLPAGSAYRPARTRGFRADRVTWAIVAVGLFAVSALFIILHALYFA